ncbi:hemolysin D [Hylemonella gracilis str. Niagara R]|uniref:Hemolysin D n=1 Tax=Hylemonella gracilis str. Niagara R TaxID=1458275 RepID=A0A016XHP4_9BURK|nr:efflux RND transporter periplasmic adaptor subunit [Hylemonella gracilis]EYC51599.1 hemolysin D [Hylemonella gracilis str. Niagara R]
MYAPAFRLFAPASMPRVYALALAISVPVLLAACGKSEATAAAGGPPAMPPMEVSVVIASPGEALLTKELPGRLQAWRTAEVRARVEGIVEERLFNEGSEVKAGMPLYRIDARTYKTTYAAAKADLIAAQAVVNRYRPLVEIKAVSQQELDTAEARLRQAEAALARAELDLENTTVPAPISGRIGRSLVTEGALVGRGEATQLATIEQIDPIYVNFTQSSVELLTLREAINSGRWKEAETRRMELVLENGSTYALPGKLLFSDLAVDPNTGSVSMRAEFPNPKKELLPGMFVRVRYPQARADQLITLPQRAVMLTQGGAIVMVVGSDGKVAPRPVQLGGMSGSNWTVTGGLSGGEQVMVEGHMKAPPGSTVKPVPWNPSPATGATAQGQSGTAPGAGQGR